MNPQQAAARSSRRPAGRVLATSALVVAASTLARQRMHRWGATPDEAHRPLPGDDLVADPHLRSTRAITVGAPAEEVFAWVAQLGQGRGGLYSYDWLENLVGLDIHSADHLLPELAVPEPGDRIRMAPGPTFYGFVVADVAVPSRLVLHMRIHPFTGAQLPATGPGPCLETSWSFVCTPVDGDSTRLVARNRASLQVPFGLRTPYLLLLDVVEFVMERRMLLGIRDRAERSSQRRRTDVHVRGLPDDVRREPNQDGA